MRVVFLGNDRWSVPSLEALAGSRHDLALVATRVPRPAGRGRAPRPTPVADAARRLELPLAEIETVRHAPGLDLVRDASPEALIVVAYGEILPRDVLELPSVAPVNVHFSLLPQLRGADPVRRALLDGLPATGVTTMRMDEGLDTGPVLLQSEEPIRDDDDAGSLGGRLAELGGGLLIETLEGLERGTVSERPQDDRLATSAPKLTPDEEWIDWFEDAAAVTRRVRALAAEPGARTRVGDRILKVLRATEADGGGEPGFVLEAGRDRLVVATGGGAVSLDEVVPEGRRAMSGADYARGRRLRAGEPLA